MVLIQNGTERELQRGRRTGVLEESGGVSLQSWALVIKLLSKYAIKFFKTTQMFDVFENCFKGKIPGLGLCDFFHDVR